MAKWKLDASHSEVGFKVRHMMISNVSGTFGTFDAEAETNGNDFDHANIVFSADVQTISTGDTNRDNHLKGADFFDAENHPKISFKSSKFEGGKLSGDLTIKGVTHPVTMDAEFAGTGKDPWGNLKAGFSISGKINRKDWGLNWNAPLEAGGVLVSEEVKLHAELQLTQSEG